MRFISANDLAANSTAAFVLPVVKTSADSPAYVEHAADSISAISAQPLTVASQIKVQVAGGTEVTLPAGMAYQMDSGHPAVRFNNIIKITVLAGTFVFSTRA